MGRTETTIHRYNRLNVELTLAPTTKAAAKISAAIRQTEKEMSQK